MRLGIITQWTTPFLGTICESILQRQLKSNGEAQILTTFPNYPHGMHHSKSGPNRKGGTLYPGVPMHRTPSHVSRDGGAKERILEYLSFAFSSLLRANTLQGSDIIYVYATPMTAAAAAMRLRLIKRIPYVLHIQDIWPESVTGSDMLGRRILSTLTTWLLNLLLIPVYSFAEHIVVNSPSAKPFLASRGVPESKITFIYNWYSGSPNQTKTKYPLSRTELHCVYAGNIGAMQDLETLIKAAVKLKDEISLRISIYGSGTHEEQAKRMARKLDAHNVDFHGRIPSAEMQGVYEDSDFQLVLLKDRNIFRANIPSKFQASMAHGRPVISTVGGDLAQICQSEGLGFSALPEDVDSLANALRQASRQTSEQMESMQRRVSSFHKNNLSLEAGTSAVFDVLEAAAKPKIRS